MTKLRPMFTERPQKPEEIKTREERQRETSLADLIQATQLKKQGYTGDAFAAVAESTYNDTHDSVILTDTAVRRILDGSPDKVAPSGVPINNSNGDGSVYTGYRAMSPIYDHHTKNKSFLRVHEQLKLLGVRNNEFFLLLLNPRLQGVDPYDPNITPDLAMMVIQECQLNFFYYLREVVRIPQQGTGVVPFELDRATLAAAYCFINDINFYLIKPRQTGKSVGICAFLSWAFKFGITNGGFAFYANKEKNSKANLKRMKTYLGLLPKYMANMGTQMYDSSGHLIRKVNNIKRYYEPVTGNTADVMNCAISEETAEELGRGDSHNFEFYDEAEFMTCIETTVQVSGPAFNTASYNALVNGMHSCRMFATTPGELSNEKKCGSAMKIVNDAVTWDEKFYNVKPLDLKKYLVKKSNYRVVYIEYSYKQLGLGEAWFVRICSMVGNYIPKIRREILLQRFAGNSASPFSEEDITELDEGMQHPVETVKFGRGGLYEIKFYVPAKDLKKNRVYFLGLDPSDGTGSDNYAITVVDPYTFKTVIEFKNQYMSPQGCRELLEYMLTKWIPKAIICIESNRNGITLIDYFKESWIKSRIYASSEASMETILTKEEYDDVGFIKDSLMKRKYYGVHTTSTTRRMMMSILVDSVKFRKDILTSENLVKDIKNLVIKNDIIKAADGKHDDCVMSWCIAMYAYYYGEKLERYGFKKGELPDDMIEDEEFENLEELYKNPLIRAQFPSMVSFYETMVRQRMETAYKEKKSATLQNIADSDVGSIVGDIAKVDPEYAKEKLPNVSGSEQAVNLRERWAKMNRRKPRENQGYTPYGTPRRNDDSDDDSWT
jgi:hypothetical protein